MKDQISWQLLTLIALAIAGVAKAIAVTWDWLSGKYEKIEADAVEEALKDKSLEDVVAHYKELGEKIKDVEVEQGRVRGEIETLKNLHRQMLQEIVDAHKHKP